jgi:hypothetical protein
MQRGRLEREMSLRKIIHWKFILAKAFEKEDSDSINMELYMCMCCVFYGLAQTGLESVMMVKSLAQCGIHLLKDMVVDLANIIIHLKLITINIGVYSRMNDVGFRCVHCQLEAF